LIAGSLTRFVWALAYVPPVESRSDFVRVRSVSPVFFRKVTGSVVLDVLTPSPLLLLLCTTFIPTRILSYWPLVVTYVYLRLRTCFTSADRVGYYETYLACAFSCTDTHVPFVDAGSSFPSLNRGSQAGHTFVLVDTLVPGVRCWLLLSVPQLGSWAALGAAVWRVLPIRSDITRISIWLPESRFDALLEIHRIPAWRVPGIFVYVRAVYS
jgi:hypothetical protein